MTLIRTFLSELSPEQKKEIMNLCDANQFYPREVKGLLECPDGRDITSVFLFLSTVNSIIAFSIYSLKYSIMGTYVFEIDFMLVDRAHRNKHIGTLMLNEIFVIHKVSTFAFEKCALIAQTKDKQVILRLMKNNFILKGMSDSKTHYVLHYEPRNKAETKK
jgi:hypothetical protein